MRRFLIGLVIVLVVVTGVIVVLTQLQPEQTAPTGTAAQNANTPVVSGTPVNAAEAPIETSPGEYVDTEDYFDDSLQELEIVDSL